MTCQRWEHIFWRRPLIHDQATCWVSGPAEESRWRTRSNWWRCGGGRGYKSQHTESRARWEVRQFKDGVNLLLDDRNVSCRRRGFPGKHLLCYHWFVVQNKTMGRNKIVPGWTSPSAIISNTNPLKETIKCSYSILQVDLGVNAYMNYGIRVIESLGWRLKLGLIPWKR